MDDKIIKTEDEKTLDISNENSEEEKAEVTEAEKKPDINEKLENEFLKIRKGEKSIKDIPCDAPYAEILITRLIKMNPYAFVELKPEQRRENDAMIFVRDRLIGTDARNDGDKLYYETLDNKPAIKFNYLSNADEIIEYFDHDLQLPTWMKVKASSAFMVENPLKLLEKINVQLTNFNMKEVYNALKITVTDIFRKEILTYIDKEKIGYFHFNVSYAALSEYVRNSLELACESFGLKVINMRIEKLIICDKIVDMIQNEYFNVRSQSTRADAEIKWAESSLEILERKSQIIEKYNLPADTLSEMEKDKAIERYLKKVNNIVEDKDKVQKPAENRNIEFDGALIQSMPEKPEEPIKPKHISVARFVILGCSFALSLALVIISAIMADMEILLIGCGLAVAFAIVIALTSVKKHKECKSLKEYAKEKAEYDEKFAVYLSDSKKYNDCKDELKKSGKDFYENDGGLYLGKR